MIRFTKHQTSFADTKSSGEEELEKLLRVSTVLVEPYVMKTSRNMSHPAIYATIYEGKR